MPRKLNAVAGLPFRTALVYAAFFAAAFWLYGLLWTTAPIREPDSGGYLRAAQDLSDFHLDQLQERAPGYPLLLLLTGSSQSPNRTLFFASLTLHFLCIWLLATVLYRNGLSEPMLSLFALILLLPTYVEPAAYVLSENLAETMLVTGFVTLVLWVEQRKSIWLGISALALGYAGFTRPTYQLLALAITGYLFLARSLLPVKSLRREDAIKAGLILICGSVILIGGYAFVNYRNFGYFGVSPKLGLTLSTKTIRVVERLPDEYGAIREALIRGRNSALVSDRWHTGSAYIWATVPELTKITGLGYRELSDYMLHVNLLLIREAPLEYLAEVFKTFSTYWFPSTTDLASLNSRSAQLLWAVIHFSLIGGFILSLILIFGATAYVKMCARHVPQLSNSLRAKLGSICAQGFIYGLAGTIIAYTSAISCWVEIGLPRYRVPTDSLIVFMLFLGTLLWWRLVESSRVLLPGHDDA